jgi:hypothetical protein
MKFTEGGDGPHRDRAAGARLAEAVSQAMPGNVSAASGGSYGSRLGKDARFVFYGPAGGRESRGAPHARKATFNAVIVPAQGIKATGRQTRPLDKAPISKSLATQDQNIAAPKGRRDGCYNAVVSTNDVVDNEVTEKARSHRVV